MTLHYLTTGDAHTTTGANYRVNATIVGRVIYETCNSIWNRLLENGYIKVPTTEAEWKKYFNGTSLTVLGL